MKANTLFPFLYPSKMMDTANVSSKDLALQKAFLLSLALVLLI